MNLRYVTLLPGYRAVGMVTQPPTNCYKSICPDYLQRGGGGGIRELHPKFSTYFLNNILDLRVKKSPIINFFLKVCWYKVSLTPHEKAKKTTWKCEKFL